MEKPPPPKKRYRPTPAVNRFAEFQLGLAFQRDCENLLKKFAAKETFSYASFAQAWTSTKFSHIFAGEQHVAPLMRQVETFFTIAKKFLMHDDIHIQTGAVFLLYGLYKRQPVPNLCRIRLVPHEWAKLLDIVESLKLCGHLDAPFVFAKMKLENALVFTLVSNPAHIDSLHPRQLDINVKVFEVNTVEAMRSEIKEACDEDLQKLEKTDDEYRKLMKKFTETCPEMQMVDSVNIRSLKRTFESIVGSKDLGEGGSAREELIRRATSNKNAVYRGDRTCITSIDLKKTHS